MQQRIQSLIFADWQAEEWMRSADEESSMFKIVHRQELKPTVVSIEVEAPLVAKKAKPGQFIIASSLIDILQLPLLTIERTEPSSSFEV